MRNDTPSTPPSGGQTREQAEAAIKERGWLPRGWDPLGKAVEGVAPADGSYTIRAYPADGPDAPRKALCRVDDWTREENDMIPYLWVVGLPSPEDAPALFARYPEATGCNDAGEIGDRILDLATGEVVAEKEAQKLVESPIPGMIQAAKDAIAEREGLFRQIVAAGWDPVYSGFSLHVSLHANFQVEEANVYSVIAGGEGSEPNSSLYLRISLMGSVIHQIHAEDPGHGIEIPIADWTTDPDIAIPTPDEAWEAYRTEWGRGTIVNRRVPVYEPSWRQ